MPTADIVPLCSEVVATAAGAPVAEVPVSAGVEPARATPAPVAAPAVLTGVPVPAAVAPGGLTEAPVSTVEPALATSEQAVAAAEATAWR